MLSIVHTERPKSRPASLGVKPTVDRPNLKVVTTQPTEFRPMATLDYLCSVYQFSTWLAPTLNRARSTPISQRATCKAASLLSHASLQIRRRRLIRKNATQSDTLAL